MRQLSSWCPGFSSEHTTTSSSSVLDYEADVVHIDPSHSLGLSKGGGGKEDSLLTLTLILPKIASCSSSEILSSQAWQCTPLETGRSL